MDSELQYPIYIISKGRWEQFYTAKLFLAENIDFKIAVEPQEYDNYCNSIGKKYILKLPFSNLGMGSTPARNYCWEHSIKNGYKKHFLFDDNILSFMRWVNNKRPRCNTKEALLVLQTISDKYKNLGMSGLEEPNFVVKFPKNPFKINCHIYSAMLINNKIPFRWRLKYNEDVDLNLQCLHNKWCTLSLVWYMANKNATTVKQKGGNQSELYQGNDPFKKQLKAKSLEMVWPQYVKTGIRYGRPHHIINWSQFKHPLLKEKTP